MAKTLLVAGAIATAAALAAAALLAPALAERETATVASVPVTYAGAHRFADPAGDARENPGAVRILECVAGYVVQRACLDPTPVGPAVPHLDIVEVALEGETADEVVVSVSLAEVADWSAFEGGEGMHRMSWVGLCWGVDEEDACSRSAYVDVMVHDGEPMLDAYFDVYSEDCNEWWWCSTSVPLEVAEGAPAKLTMRVPKAALAPDGGALAMHGLRGYSGWFETPTVFPMWHGGVTVHTPLRHVHDHSAGVGTWSVTDWTDRQAIEVGFAAPASMERAAGEGPVLAAVAGMTHADGSSYAKPEYDLVGFDLFEEPGVLVAEFALARMGEAPPGEFDYSVAVGLGELVYEIGYRTEGGHAVGYAGRCVMEECQDAFIEEVEATVVPGEPGFVQVRVPLELLGSPAPGTATNLVWALTMASDGSVYFGEYDAPVYGDVHSVFMVDSAWGGLPYVIGSGHRAAGYDLAGHH